MKYFNIIDFTNTYIISRDQDRLMFYDNNWINWDKFSIFDFNWIEKSIKNVDTVASKLRPTLIKVKNHSLVFVGKKKQKSEEIIKKQKTKAMVTKQYRGKRRISFYNKKNKKSDIKNNLDPD